MEMKKNDIMEAVLSWKLNHDGNQAVAIGNICKAVEGYLPMLEQLGEVMDSFWNRAEDWGFMEITSADVNGMKIPAEYLETMKRVRDAMYKIASPMNMNMFWDYLDYQDGSESYLFNLLGTFEEYMGLDDLKEELLMYVNDREMDELQGQFNKNLLPRVSRVWDALKNDNTIQQNDADIDDWVANATSIDALYDVRNLPSMEQAFNDFCRDCSIPANEELKALWMAD
jgi:hypothetical protein